MRSHVMLNIYSNILTIQLTQTSLRIKNMIPAFRMILLPLKKSTDVVLKLSTQLNVEPPEVI